jgi:hypothetical protein
VKVLVYFHKTYSKEFIALKAGEKNVVYSTIETINVDGIFL